MLFMFAAAVGDHPRNPAVRPELSIQKALDVPPQVDGFLRRACYDCHSSETRWPWYSAVRPFSHLIESDVKHGRSVMNFSEWGATEASPAHAASTLVAACAAVQSGIMPKSPYPYIHPDARVTQADVKTFCEWTREQSSMLRATARRQSNVPSRGIHN
jgi:Haem-binding domain